MMLLAGLFVCSSVTN